MRLDCPEFVPPQTGTDISSTTANAQPMRPQVLGICPRLAVRVCTRSSPERLSPLPEPAAERTPVRRYDQLVA